MDQVSNDSRVLNPRHNTKVSIQLYGLAVATLRKRPSLPTIKGYKASRDSKDTLKGQESNSFIRNLNLTLRQSTQERSDVYYRYFYVKSPTKLFQGLTSRCDVRIPDILIEVFRVCSHTFQAHKNMPSLLLTRNLARTLQEELFNCGISNLMKPLLYITSTHSVTSDLLPITA